jgi:hypothetical protein
LPSEIYVEWINGDKAERLFRQRRAAAIRKARETDPERSEDDIVSPLEQDSCWEWVEFEECTETRKFPSVAMAMGWGHRNHQLDAFDAPRIYRNEWNEGQHDWEATTTISLQYEGFGVWLDTEKGAPYEPPAKTKTGAK